MSISKEELLRENMATGTWKSRIVLYPWLHKREVTCLPLTLPLGDKAREMGKLRSILNLINVLGIQIPRLLGTLNEISFLQKYQDSQDGL